MVLTKWLIDTNLSEVELVGGKNASLGEMISNLSALGINVPNGFVISAKAYDEFLSFNNLHEKISEILDSIDYDDAINLRKNAQKIRILIQNGEYPDNLRNEILDMYKELSKKYNQDEILELDVAVRSSATTEDLQDASFAGQQDTYLNVRGETQLLDKIKSCFASVFNERAIDYRHELNFSSMNVKLSVCI